MDSKAVERQTEAGIMVTFSPYGEVVIYVFPGLAINVSHTKETQIKKDYDGKIILKHKNKLRLKPFNGCFYASFSLNNIRKCFFRKYLAENRID